MINIEWKEAVWDKTETEGLGDIVASSDAPDTYQTIAAAHTDGARIRYTVMSATQRESGEGVWNAGTNSFTREVMLYTTSGGAKVSFAAGVKDVFTGPMAADLNDIVADLATKSTVAEAAAAAPVQMVAGRTGNIVLTTDDVAEGSRLYHTGARAIGSILTGLSTASGTIVTSSHSILQAVGFLQKQTSDNLATLVSHTGNSSNPHGVNAAQAGAVAVNAPITGATKTKISFDAKGLVTAGADATTADIADSADRRYVTDSQRTVIQNTTGLNTGDQDLSGLVPKTTTVNGHALTGNVSVTPADLSLVIGTDVQAYSATLAAIAAIVLGTSTFPARASTGALAAQPISDFSIARMADASDSAWRAGLGLGSIAMQAANAIAVTGGTAAGLTGLGLRSSGSGAFDLSIANSENLTAGRTLTFALGDANRTLTIGAAASVAGSNNGDQTITLTGGVTGSGTDSFAVTVITNANLTGDATSVGNATTVGKINGTSLAVLATGILKNTTTTGVPSIAVAADFPTLNQNTTGSAATLTTARAINGVSFNGSADITVTAAAGTLSGATLAAGVTASSLTSVDILTGGATGAGFTVALSTSTITGTLPAARLPAFTGGDVTSGAGSAVLTIANSAVSLAKMADVATASVFYRKTAGTGAPEVQTLATLKADLGLVGTNTGDQTTVTGNAGTATVLQTARAIYGNNFDGSAALSQIIASTYGGSGNGFTKFTGPATTEKTFTLPNASSTLLYDGGALGTPSSATLTNASGLPAAGVVGTAAILAANTFTRLQTITQGTANEGIIASTGHSLTGSNAQSLIDMAWTWNTTGTPKGLKFVVTNTASNASSRLISIELSTGDLFYVSPTLTSSNVPIRLSPSGASAGTWLNSSGSGQLNVGNGAADGSGSVKCNRYLVSSNGVAIDDNGTANGLALGTGHRLHGSNSTAWSGTIDVTFKRDTTGVWGIFDTGSNYRDLKLRNLLVGGGNGSYIQTPSMTVSNLAAAGTAGNGARAYVIDSTLAFLGNAGTAVIGSGANHTPVIVVNGAWVIG